MGPYKAWLIAAVLSLIVEVLPPPTHFFFLCVAFGALSAAIAAFFSPLAWLPWTVFSVMTIILTPVLIPLARFLFSSKPHASNVDALLGARALVLDRIDPKVPGSVKINGEQWRALSDDVLEKDVWATVVKVEGAHVIVRRA